VARRSQHSDSRRSSDVLSARGLGTSRGLCGSGKEALGSNTSVGAGESQVGWLLGPGSLSGLYKEHSKVWDCNQQASAEYMFDDQLCPLQELCKWLPLEADLLHDFGHVLLPRKTCSIALFCSPLVPCK
jgi:hypothetical protein